MNTFFNAGKPVDYTVFNIADAVITLEPKGHKFAVVQFQDTLDNYGASPGEIALYNRQGIDPDQDPAQPNHSFIAGKNDTVVFSNAELFEGVKIINHTNGAGIRAVVQYYAN